MRNILSLGIVNVARFLPRREQVSLLCGRRHKELLGARLESPKLQNEQWKSDPERLGNRLAPVGELLSC